MIMTFNKTTIWLVIGLIGQLTFAARFIIQWLHSEKHRKSLIPVPFWYFSIVGAIILFTYAVHREDPVFIIGQGLGLIVYSRNLYFLSLEKKVKKLKNRRSHMQRIKIFLFLLFFATLSYADQVVIAPPTYIFQKNTVEVGGFSTAIFDPPNYNSDLTAKHLFIPIFFSGSVSLNNGLWLRYERNVFHTSKMFSIDIGSSLSTYHSKNDNTSFQVASLFPMLRFWFLRFPSIDIYFMYSIGGPSYITTTQLDGRYLGTHFIFQDLLGFGFVAGKSKHFNMDISIGHYSNANLYQNNSGINVPLTLSLGYTFS